MDKETLSNYGWIVICVLVLAVMLALATPFGQFISDAVWNTANGLFDTNNNALDNVLGDLGVVPTPEQLQAKYKFEYYSTLNGAVNDVNNDTIGKNADVNKEDAVAGIYTDAGEAYVVLLKDTTESERVKPAADMTINLGGNTLSSNDNVVLQPTAGTIMIDGRLNGSSIEVSTTDKMSARAIQCLNDSTTIINGGTYIGSSNSASANGACIATYHTTSLSISNANIIGIGQGGMERAICINSGNATITNCNISSQNIKGNTYAFDNLGTVTITNCNITAQSAEGYAHGFDSAKTARTTITNSNIKAYSNYSAVGDTYTSMSVGIGNKGSLTLNNCYAMGTHSGVTNSGDLTVNSGTYEGYGHGGFYFSGANNASYVRDAIIRECKMPEGYVDGGAGCNGSGFYIGGGPDCDNITLYMDNCDIYGSRQPIVLRGSSGEKNNTLYISNSNINLNYTYVGVRIDSNTHKLYIGDGCNFTEDNTKSRL